MQDEDCLFCPKPEKRTEWHHVDDTCLVIDKPSGEPMIVLDRHDDQPSVDEAKHMDGVLNHLFDEFDVEILMNHVENHWHGHIVDYEWAEDE